MNLTELARKLKINTQELRDKLPELGFDIGQKAIKVDNQLAAKIGRAWTGHLKREQQKTQYLKFTPREESTEGKILDKTVEVPGVLTVRDLATLLKLPITTVIGELMRNGVMASLNQRIDFETAAIVAAELGYEAKQVNSDSQIEVNKGERLKEKLFLDKDNLQSRPPVIVVMGHVDHGKTRLLDAIRRTNVMEGEAGGITQHIGAYQVQIKGRKLTFIDTPGHEAFTAMRSRGARVADIAILVVAATEGVKPQTVEALKIAQNANLPIIVAVNKIDLPEANVDKVKQELANYNLLAEEWGGKTIFVPISAKLNKNIDGLLERVLLLADMNAESIKANPEGDFVGSVVEAHVDKGEGPVATVLVKNGTLRVGDYVVMNGILYGKIRSMKNYKDQPIAEAGLSVPARLLGLKVAPKVGDVLEVTKNPRKVKKAKVYAMKQQDETFIKAEAAVEGSEKSVKLNIILRTDVLGSQEAIFESLQKMEAAGVKVEIVSKGLGSITENDVLTAESTGAVILGFNVVPSTSAQSLAQEKKVVIKVFKIIYELLSEVRERLRALIKSELVRQDLGKMEVLKLFKKSNTWQVVGGKVIQGRLEPNAKAAVLRKGEFIVAGKITELQTAKQAVTDAVKGQECGIKFLGEPLIEEKDILDIYKEMEVKRQI